MTEPIKLYQLKDIAVIFGVGASAVANWRKRGSGPVLPDPQFVTSSGRPLFTEDQVRTIMAEHIAQMESIL